MTVDNQDKLDAVKKPYKVRDLTIDATTKKTNQSQKK